MKNFLLLLFFIASSVLISLQAQEVPRTIIVEHFTNTRCGVCSSRNPSFYTNLNAHPDVLHISIHPGSPYSSCQLHQVNPTENDARTNYYGLYGSTPKLAIQGTAVSTSTNYGSAAIFEQHQDQTTPVSLRIRQTKQEGEIIVSVIVKAEADNSIGNAKLFLAAAEDIVFYNAPNGEDEHYDVFRRTFNGEPSGASVDVPAMAGDSIVISASIMPDVAWDYNRLFAIAILQDSEDRSVIQATASDPSDNEPLVSTNEVNTLAANIYPNPVQDELRIQLEDATAASYKLFDTKGRLLQSGSFSGQTSVQMGNYPAGIYWVEIQTTEAKAVRRIVK